MWRSGCFALWASLVLAAAAQQPVPAVQKAWDTMDKSLSDNDLEHRLQALAALATVPGSDAAAVKRAENALQDKSPRVRQAAALALGKMGAKQAAPYLKQALTDTGEVAFAAAKSLMEMGEDCEDARDILVAVLAGERKDTPGIITNARREAEYKLKHPQGLLLMGAEDATGAMFGPAAMGITAAKDAMDLRSKGTPGRAAAAAYLAKDPSPYAITLLEWALSDDNQFVRAEAAKALGERGTADSIPKLQSALDDSHTRVRTMAAAAIVRLADKTNPALSSASNATPGKK